MRTHGVTHYTPDTCFGCKVRTVQLQAAPAFQPHYNWSVGAHVNTDREYRDELKRCEERNCLSTGIDHSYEPRYPGDIPKGDITATEKVIHDNAVADRLINPCQLR